MQVDARAERRQFAEVLRREDHRICWVQEENGAQFGGRASTYQGIVVSK